jgi:hypothetical protein
MSRGSGESSAPGLAGLALGRVPVLLTAAGTLVLALWVTAASLAAPIGASRTTGGAPPGLPTGDGPPHSRPHGRTPTALPHGSDGLITLVGSVLLGGIAIALIALLVLTFMRRHRRAAVDPPTPVPVGDSAAVPALGISARAVEDARQILLSHAAGDPRNAIVACWMDLERTCADAGLPRRLAETSSDFTERVLAASTEDQPAVETLAALFLEARFSRHPLGDREHAAALGALERVLSSTRLDPDLEASGRRP